MKYLKFLAFCLAILTLANCSQMHELHELLHVREAVIDRYKTEEVRIEIYNNNAIYVFFDEPPFNNLPGNQQKIKAKEIAKFVKKKYTLINDIQTVSVYFMPQKSLTGNETERVKTFDFKTTQL